MRAKGRRPRPAEAKSFGAGPVELAIEEVGARGDGIAAHNGERVFIPFTLPGERVRAEIVARRADGLAAVARERIVDSPDRVAPPCPHFGVCGGCALQHWRDESYAEWKMGLVRTALARHGFRDPPIGPLHRTPPGSRRRAGLVASWQGDTVRLGYRERGSHRLVDLRACPVLVPMLADLIPRLRDGMAGLAPTGGAWDCDATATETGVDLVVTSADPPDPAQRERLAALADALDLARLSWRSAEGAAAEPIAWRRSAIVRFAGIAVQPPPGGFLQASAEGEAALAAAVLTGTEGAKRVADLYSGCGTFTIPLAATGARVTAADLGADALAALMAAARSSDLGPRIETLRRNLDRDPLSPAELDGFDAVVFDPPRAGARAQAAAIAASRVPVVVAVSCYPATFARDARTLVDGGYRLIRIVPVDQFLWSPHVELAALFRRE